ncbi:CMRF35-like molecule 7 [Trematomus bernacchii]|uniref:CMRF35-like molecule 7 n=1 Tax=Trematomus bernacchii TaxID=40690 RepID=UPI00146DA099|nr:CMRF35-like molecule 7 [Trematomus bernacchii]
MTVQLSFLLLFAGLKGIHSITTVSKVSVRAGGSITIPCLYESKYSNHVKYLCKGSTWDFCSYEVTTNKPSSSGKFSISDDRRQRVFTVTINDLTEEDTGYYWCVVEIDDGADLKEYFHLSVTAVSTWISKKRKWCRLGGSCVTKSGSIDGTRVEISARNPGVLTVTLSGLRTESSGWYRCVKGDLQMPVHITLTEKPTTRVIAQGGHTSPYEHFKNFGIRVAVVIFVVMVTVFIWCIYKRYQQIKVESSATTVTYVDSFPNVTVP